MTQPLPPDEDRSASQAGRLLNIQVLFFASLREQLGTGQLQLQLPAQTTVGEARGLLAQRGGAWREALSPGQVVMAALDHQLCTEDARLTQDGELAFFTPVTGG